MLTKLRNRMAREESGFTLIELLVVMLILGILAAIAIPSFFAQQDKARDADAKAAVRTAQTAVETYRTDNDGSYASVTSDPTTPYAAGSLQSIEETLSSVGANLTVTSDADTYSVQVAEPDTGNAFRISRGATGTTTLECGATAALGSPLGAAGQGRGGCPADGTW